MSRYEERGGSSGSDESHGRFTSIRAPDRPALADLAQLKYTGPVIPAAVVIDLGFIQEDYIPLIGEDGGRGGTLRLQSLQDELPLRLQALRHPGV